MTEKIFTLSIASEHPAFAGHFPGSPIVPGVVLLDEALHIMTAECGSRLARISNTKFLSPVRPGEAVQLHYESSSAGMLRFHLRCKDRTVATGAVHLIDATENE